MSLRHPSVLSRTYSALKRWLSQTWISRIPLGFWSRGWREWLCGESAAASRQRPSFRPDIMALEDRVTPDDICGALVTSLAGGLWTPSAALFNVLLGEHHLAPLDFPEPA